MLKAGWECSRDSLRSVSNHFIKQLKLAVPAPCFSICWERSSNTDTHTETHTHTTHTHTCLLAADQSAFSGKLARKTHCTTLLFQDLSTHQRTDLLCILRIWMTVRGTSVPRFSVWIHMSTPAALAIGQGPPANSAALQRQLTEPSWAHYIGAFSPVFSVLHSISLTVCHFYT